MTDTPDTDNLARGNRVVLTESAQDLECERNNLQDQRDFAISEMDRLEEERDQARSLADAAAWEADRLYGRLWRARDRAWKLARERNRLKSQISNLKSP